ncbi:MAG: protoporphyrinogen/coproporphyrinogen oxidase [Actinomycetota bacterium]|nr:protoporphyrinogen/coproporphyrinogen oxidase [Actinomycetota bacterium]
MTRINVVGGGIAGLAAAWFLERRGFDVEVHEATGRLGGKIATGDVEGHPVELGPDAFLARVHDGVELCRALGLGDELVAPATGQAHLLHDGQLRPLPEGLVLGVPSDVLAVARSGVLSPLGLLRAAAEPFLPGRPLQHDATVGSVVRNRFGDEVFEKLVDPLVSGINAGRADELSIDASTPQLAALARRDRSLLVGARRSRRTAPAGGPVFLTVRSGLSRLVEKLAADLRGKVHLDAPVASLDDLDGDGVVVAVPAFAAAGLLDGEAGRELAAIPYASVALTVLTYPVAAVRRHLDGSGFLVPRREGRLMTACSWGSSKWPHWAGRDRVVLRVSAGRSDDTRAMDLGDDELVARLHTELDGVIGVRAQPDEAVVTRWPRSFPQYHVGHLERVARIEAALATNVAVAGAAYRGVGVPACIASGRAAAERLAATLIP